ncbi:MAG: hypothetical protein ACREO8_10275 [Luteimonas sp.]
MPLLSDSGQADRASAWFQTAAGQAVIASERTAIAQALSERLRRPWLWLAPSAVDGPVVDGGSAGLALSTRGSGWTGAVHCGLPLPLAGESLGTVVLQHVVRPDARGRALLDDCARVLVPGGILLLFALNPLTPYRWRWRGSGLSASEPLSWRHRLRTAGLQARPVSQGIGPIWKPLVSADLQHGPGLRAAYAIRADKRTLPLTPVRRSAPLRIAHGAPAA